MPTGTPPPLLPGVLRIAQSYECLPCQATTVQYFQCHETGGLGASDVLNMVTALAGFWLNDVWAKLATASATSTTVDATYALIEGAPNVKKVHIADAVIGVQPVSELPGQVSCLVLWDTGDPRRGGKPRTYSPFPSDAMLTDAGNIDPTTVAAATGWLTTFLGHVAGHTAGALVADEMIEYSEVTHKAYRGAGFAYPISSGTLSPIWANQRRRVDRLR